MHPSDLRTIPVSFSLSHLLSQHVPRYPRRVDPPFLLSRGVFWEGLEKADPPLFMSSSLMQQWSHSDKMSLKHTPRGSQCRVFTSKQDYSFPKPRSLDINLCLYDLISNIFGLKNQYDENFPSTPRIESSEDFYEDCFFLHFGESFSPLVEICCWKCVSDYVCMKFSLFK